MIWTRGDERLLSKTYISLMIINLALYSFLIIEIGAREGFVYSVLIYKHNDYNENGDKFLCTSQHQLERKEFAYNFIHSWIEAKSKNDTR